MAPASQAGVVCSIRRDARDVHAGEPRDSRRASVGVVVPATRRRVGGLRRTRRAPRRDERPARSGELLYTTPLGIGVSKGRGGHGWGDPERAFWCCYGTAVEALARLQHGVFWRARAGTPEPRETSESAVPSGSRPRPGVDARARHGVRGAGVDLRRRALARRRGGNSLARRSVRATRQSRARRTARCIGTAS